MIPGFGIQSALIAALIGGVGMCGAGAYGYFKGKTAGKAEVQAILDKAVANANAAATIASENYRRSEAEWQDKIAKAQTSYTERQAQHETELASVRAAAAADVGKLRRALSRVAASGPATSDPAPSTGDCASTAGELLGQGLQLSAELARDAETNADAYRALLAGWPR